MILIFDRPQLVPALMILFDVHGAYAQNYLHPDQKQGGSLDLLDLSPAQADLKSWKIVRRLSEASARSCRC